MKERPIIFNGDMVRSILNGQKTQTRRPVNNAWLSTVQRVIECNDKWVWEVFDGRLTTPFGEPGDRLWVKETFHCCDWHERCYFKADKEDADGYHGCFQASGWKPSIHMPRWASRITLEITDIRVERVQDISIEDALAEGIKICNSGTPLACYWDYLENESRSPVLFNARDSFCTLWYSIYSEKYPWKSNPWVWVVEFKKLEATNVPA